MPSFVRTYEGFWAGNPGGYGADTNPCVLGIRGTINVAGYILGARYYRDNSDGGRHFAFVSLSWTVKDRHPVATFPIHVAGAQGAAGWESAYFRPRIKVPANQQFALFVWFEQGRYWRTAGALSAGAVTVGHFTLAQDTAAFFNGALTYSLNMQPGTREGGALWGTDLIFFPS